MFCGYSATLFTQATISMQCKVCFHIPLMPFYCTHCHSIYGRDCLKMPTTSENDSGNINSPNSMHGIT